MPINMDEDSDFIRNLPESGAPTVSDIIDFCEPETQTDHSNIVTDELLTERLEKFAIGNNEGETNPKEQEEVLGDQELETLNTGIEEILKGYPDRKAWNAASTREFRSIHRCLQGIGAESESCVNLLEGRGLTLKVRHTLIKNGYGRITPEMVKNQEEWQKYLPQVRKAQGDLLKYLNWATLRLDDWEKRKEALGKFWDLFENNEARKDRDMLGVCEIIPGLFRRQAFLRTEMDKMLLKYDATFKTLPTWIEWDVVP